MQKPTMGVSESLWGETTSAELHGEAVDVPLPRSLGECGVDNCNAFFTARGATFSLNSRHTFSTCVPGSSARAFTRRRPIGFAATQACFPTAPNPKTESRPGALPFDQTGSDKLRPRSARCVHRGCLPSTGQLEGLGVSAVLLAHSGTDSIDHGKSGKIFARANAWHRLPNAIPQSALASELWVFPIPLSGQRQKNEEGTLHYRSPVLLPSRLL